MSELTKVDSSLLPNVAEVGFDDPTIGNDDVQWYKGRKGRVDRITLLNPKSMVVGDVHYKEGLGGVLCQSEYAVNGTVRMMKSRALCCEHLPEAQRRILLMILRYDTRDDGNLVQPFGFTPMFWRLSESKFAQLRTINGEWPLDQHDLLVRCEDEEWQRMTFSATKQSVYRSEQFQTQFGAQVTAWTASMTPKLRKMLGKSMTAQELLDKLGLAVGPMLAAQADAPIADISEFLK